MLLRFFSASFMWIIWIYKKNWNTEKERKMLMWLENSYHPLILLSLSLRIITQVIIGQCTSAFSIGESTTACNYFQDTRSVHPTFLVSLMLIPLLAHFFIRETRVESVAVSWLISVGTLTFCAIYMKSEVLVYPIVFYACASLLIFYDTKRQNDDMLKLVAALQAAAEEVERLQEETRASELRAMIGNVAHDLKTVSLRSICAVILNCALTLLLLISRRIYRCSR
jgi:hypothetical protein